MRGNRLRAALAAAVIGLGVGATASPGSALAAPKKSVDKAADARARELFQRGDEAYAEGRYEDAHTAFAEAYELSGRPQLLFNVANALERLGRHAEALEALEEYLESGKATRDRDVVEKRIANLQRRVDEQQRAEEEARREAERRERERQEAAAEAAASEGARAEAEPAAEKRPTRVLPFVMLGTGAAALVTSAVFGGLTLAARSEAEPGCRSGSGGRLCSAEASAALGRDEAFGLVTDIALASGVILSGVGLYLLLSGDDDERPAVDVRAGASRGSSTASGRARGPRESLRVEARPAGAGVQIVGRF